MSLADSAVPFRRSRVTEAPIEPANRGAWENLRQAKVLLDMRPVRQPISGVARYCLGLSQGLSELLPETEFLALCNGNEADNPFLSELDPSLRRLMPQNAKRFNILSEFAPIFARVPSAGSCDLVHETYFARPGGIQGRKRVVTIHDVIPLDRPEYFNRRNRIFSLRNFRRQVREADRLICVSSFTRDRVIALSDVDPGKIDVVPNGVSFSDQLTTVDPWKPSAEEFSRYLLFIGNIEPRKNLRTLIKAVHELGANFDDLGLVVAGHPNYRAEEDLEYGREVLGPRFRYRGSVSEEEKWSLLRGAQAFVFPSLYEGFGIPIIECYKAGCPVLIADNSSMTELSVDPRQLFDAQSVADLKAALERALSEPGWLQQTVSAGLQRVNQYTWERVAKDTADIFESALSGV